VLVFVDRWFKQNPDDSAPDQPISYRTAIAIGFFQCLAMVPGVSRSAASIIGGMTQQLSRRQAAEFSFFLAVPTMFAASAYKLLKDLAVVQQSENLSLLIWGNVIAFVVAMVAIKTFIGLLTRYGFKVFGYYRIALGLLILGMLAMGYQFTL
jgi:undecaprenyl-diphosphatase